MLKKDDKVRILAGIEQVCSVYKVGEVVTIVTEYNQYSFDVQREGDSYTQTVFRAHIELITESSTLPTDKAERKATPITTGVLDYFPAAIAEVARVSLAGNEQHHAGEPLYWERGKSADHADTISRHLIERGTLDVDGQRHSAKVAWRALALLQEELEAAGSPQARGSR